MKTFMALTVTTDEQLSPNSKKVVIKLPTGGNLPNLLFDLGLVSEVNGYENFKALVVEQTGFQGEMLVGTKINFYELLDWDDLLCDFDLSNLSDEKVFALEAYMRFTGVDVFQVHDIGVNTLLDQVSLFPVEDTTKLKSYLARLLLDYWQLNVIPSRSFIDWDAVLGDTLERGFGMLYKGHYIFLNPNYIGKIKPLPYKLNQKIYDHLANLDFDGNNCFVDCLGELTFQALLNKLHNSEPLPPIFLDNILRETVFRELAKAVNCNHTNHLVDGYEKIWVKPVKEV